jgi:hypothetical protein
MGLSRRDFLIKSISTIGITGLGTSVAVAMSLHCTPTPIFPVPLDVGTWHSAPFPVGKHSYNISFTVDRTLPLEQLDCDLGPTSPFHRCYAPPLLDIDWKIWDGSDSVKTFRFDPVTASAWAADETTCMLGTFEGKRNGMFTLEWTVKKDPGRLRGLHPRIEVAKNPGYWCWL